MANKRQKSFKRIVDEYGNIVADAPFKKKDKKAKFDKKMGNKIKASCRFLLN